MHQVVKLSQLFNDLFLHLSKQSLYGSSPNIDFNCDFLEQILYHVMTKLSFYVHFVL